MDFIDSWELVRYVPQGSTWHPATDQLNGTQVYGTFGDFSQAFSMDWSSTNFNEVRLMFCILVFKDIFMFKFLFISGDKKYWTVIKKVDLVGEDDSKWYANEEITIQSSQIRCTQYEAKMYRRSNFYDDPFVSFTNHGAGENVLCKGSSSEDYNGILEVSSGMYVYIS